MKNYKENIDKIKPYEPGKPIEDVKRDLKLKKVIKLASNENPLGPSKKAIAALRLEAASVQLYPDGGVYELKRAIAKHHKVKPTEVIVGNGSNEIIEFLVKGFVSTGDRVVSSDITFLVYPLVTQTQGADYTPVAMRTFKYDVAGILKAIDKRTKLIFIANPNNPTGSYISEKELAELIQKVPKDIIICIDEAYVDFVNAPDFPKTLKYLKKNNVIILRTFSKAFGLAGLRLGYGLANERLIGYLHKIRQPFNVNTLAQKAGIAALADKAHLKQTQKVVIEGRCYFEKQFKDLGLFCVSSQANFVLVCVKTNSQRLFKDLLKRGIIVRDMVAYGMNEWIRVTVGTMAENRLFIKELKQVLK